MGSFCAKICGKDEHEGRDYHEFQPLHVGAAPQPQQAQPQQAQPQQVQQLSGSPPVSHRSPSEGQTSTNTQVVSVATQPRTVDSVDAVRRQEAITTDQTRSKCGSFLAQGDVGEGTVRVSVRNLAGDVMLDNFLPETMSARDIEETLLADRKHLGIMPNTKQEDVTSGRFQTGYQPIVELLQDGEKVINFVTLAFLKERSNPIELTCVFRATVVFENNENYNTMWIRPGTEGDLHTQLVSVNKKWETLIKVPYPEFIAALHRTSASTEKIRFESKMFEKFEEIAGTCEGMYVSGMCYFEGRIGGHIVSMGIDT